MEHQAGFDVDKALLAWKQDCASRPGMSSEDARELECHLRDCVGEFQARGMTAEEAFHAALGQVGLPEEIAREFAAENPLAVWGDRVFWAATAALAYSVWASVSTSTVWWVFRDFGPLLPFAQSAAWYSIFCYLPVLMAGALMATGGLGRAREWLHWWMQSRPRFAWVGATSLVVVTLVQLLEMPQGSWQRNVMLFLSLLLWPTILLAAGTALLRPLASPRWAGSGADPAVATRGIWRERVFWMAAVGLMMGSWWSVTGFGIVALFYTGDINHPYQGHILVWVVAQILELAPVAPLAWLLFRQNRGGWRLPSDVAPAKQSIIAMAAVMLCALLACKLGTMYLWQPRDVPWAWGNALMAHVSTFQWLWPAGLAALVVWLAPGCQETPEVSV